MKPFRVICSLLAALLFSLTVFSGVSFSASAADALPSGGRWLTPAETLQMIGETIPAQYFNGTDYTNVEARYSLTITNSEYPDFYYNTSSDTSLYPYIEKGRSYLVYSCGTLPTNVNSNVSYVTFDISSQYSFFDTEYLYMWVACSTGSTSSPYQAPNCRGLWDGQSVYIENSDNVNGTHATLVLGYNSVAWQNTLCTFVPIALTSSSPTSGYIDRVCFYGSGYSDQMYLMIGCPYVSADMYGESGTYTETSGTSSGSGDINVNVDMTETNGLLGTLISAVQSLGSFILDGLQSLFVPSEDAITAFKNRLDTLLHDTFGAVYDAQELTDSAVRQILTASAVDSVHFDGTTVDVSAIAGAGAVVQFPAMTVPLKPEASKLSLLYSTLAKILDIVCTIAVLNMLRTKFDAIIFGEKVVDSYAD